MNAVVPIRDKQVLESILKDLRAINMKYFAVVLVGIYTGLRISDMLRLRVGDMRKPELKIRQKKNGSWITLPVHPDLLKGMEEYIAGKPDDELLFMSRQVKLKTRIKSALDRSTVYKMINKVCRKYNLSFIGCHTLRKTFGYHLYMASEKNIGLLMEIFGHSDPSITLRYIGITQDTINAAILKFKY